MKKNIKKFGVLLITLFCLGLSGLFIGLVEIDRHYAQNKENIDILVNEVMRLDRQVELDGKKLKNYAFMEYKVNAFARRYALYSTIVDAVYKKSRQYGFEPELVLAVIQVESAFDEFAISVSGARGLMQVMPFWLNELGRRGDDLFDIHTNLRFGCTILKLYLDRERGDRTRALARYNGSVGRSWYPQRIFKALAKRWYRQ